MNRPILNSTLFPYTTLFRSRSVEPRQEAKSVSVEHTFEYDVTNPTELERYLLDLDRKSTRLNSSHVAISYAVFCLKKKTGKHMTIVHLTSILFYYRKNLSTN